MIRFKLSTWVDWIGRPNFLKDFRLLMTEFLLDPNKVTNLCIILTVIHLFALNLF